MNRHQKTFDQAKYWGYLQTPIGQLMITATDEGISLVEFFDSKPKPESQAEIIQRAKTQLAEYFKGSRECFDLPLAVKGTSFQRRVWQALLTVPYGRTASYADIAAKIGNPKAVRAVGAANGNNPISIIVPCHRIIGSNGKLTGYAGGIERKSWLLDLEQPQLVLT